ncbi:hypothetical protein [Chromobacterium subtsugae]|uniref:hypothetical protein n=1 Tax=Chromobacterium subtsugae TaxID=251747 RepID=UPI000640E752|nr:hypothetical protein [Chromobacterium subtsugae]
MRYRKLDANGDYVIGSGADFYANEVAAVAQAVVTRLRLWRAEWFLDTSDGTPWLQDALGQAGKTAIDAALRARILATPGVTEITAYGSQFAGNSRELAISATISTIYGVINIQETM